MVLNAYLFIPNHRIEEDDLLQTSKKGQEFLWNSLNIICVIPIIR